MHLFPLTQPTTLHRYWSFLLWDKHCTKDPRLLCDGSPQPGKLGKKLNVKSTSNFIPLSSLYRSRNFGFHLFLRKNVISPDISWFVSFSITAKPKSEEGMMPVSSKEHVVLLGCVISICCILVLVLSLDPSSSWSECFTKDLWILLVADQNGLLQCLCRNLGDKAVTVFILGEVGRQCLCSRICVRTRGNG